MPVMNTASPRATGPPEQLRAQIKLRRVAGVTTLLSISRFIVMNLQGFAISSAVARIRTFFIVASTRPSRSPATMVCRIFCPVSPTTSEMTLVSWMFICMSAFCMRCTCMLWLLTSIPHWRHRERDTHTASVGRNAPRRKPYIEYICTVSPSAGEPSTRLIAPEKI